MSNSNNYTFHILVHEKSNMHAPVDHDIVMKIHLFYLHIS